MQTGINLSRSTVRTFKHNDMEDLERVLQVRDCCLRRNRGEHEKGIEFVLEMFIDHRKVLD